MFAMVYVLKQGGRRAAGSSLHTGTTQHVYKASRLDSLLPLLLEA